MAYIKFREIQEASFYHPNFHGSRDCYEMIKQIRRGLDSINSSELEDEELRTNILGVVNVAIKTNFSGCMYRDAEKNGLMRTSNEYFTQCFIDQCFMGDCDFGGTS